MPDGIFERLFSKSHKRLRSRLLHGQSRPLPRFRVPQDHMHLPQIRVAVSAPWKALPISQASFLSLCPKRPVIFGQIRPGLEKATTSGLEIMCAETGIWALPQSEHKSHAVARQPVTARICLAAHPRTFCRVQR